MQGISNNLSALFIGLMFKAFRSYKIYLAIYFRYFSYPLISYSFRFLCFFTNFFRVFTQDAMGALSLIQNALNGTGRICYYYWNFDRKNQEFGNLAPQEI